MGDNKRTPRAMGQLTVGTTDDNDGIGTTIVGGQPHKGRRPARGIPVGVERVLYAAAVDQVFRAELLEDRVEAPRSRGFSLTDSEQAMLRFIPEAQLLASIDGMDTSAENLKRRSFMQVVAAGAVTVAAGEVVAGCSDDDKEPPKDVGTESMVDMGVRPDDGFSPDMGVRPNDIAPPPEGGSPDMGVRPSDIGPDAPPIQGIKPDMPPSVKDGAPQDVVMPHEVGSYGIRPKG